jgi:Fis family transcriptional regulator
MTRTVNGRGAAAKAARPVPRKPVITDVRLKNRPLRDFAEEALQKYFRDLNGHKPGDLYDLVLGEVEEPLFKTVMEHTQGNQSVAAAILGINRATLRKKLRHYQLVG